MNLIVLVIILVHRIEDENDVEDEDERPVHGTRA
jgi:hypothetical protein